jgi:small subunit ribosomal protein S7
MAKFKLITPQAFKIVKLKQLEKYHTAQTEEERAEVELNPLTLFHRAMKNVKPHLSMTPIKRGGVTYQAGSSLGSSIC